MFENGQGPWGSSEPPEKDNKKKQDNSENSNNILDDVLKNFKELLEGLKNKKKSNNPKKSPFNPHMKSSISFVVMIVVALWLSTGIYKINPEENGVVLYFGKFHSISTPGLNYHIPKPIGDVEKVSVTRINKEEFGFRTAESGQSTNPQYKYKVQAMPNFEDESLMLTGDENIADIDFEVQWKVGDVKNYLFNIANPKLTIRKATESAMREIIAKRPINDALASKKSDIEREVRDLLQDILSSYKSGIEVIIVQMLRVDPPQQVINAFRDVQTAKADKERKINEAEAYQNDIIPKARGEAEKILQEAEAYQKSTVADATGQAERFNKVYKEYSKAKAITKKRMYLETMEEVYQNVDKIIIDEKLGRSVLPYLPLDNKKN